MRKVLFTITFLLSLIATTISAQDLIVTEKGDSLNCKITKEQNDYIFFTYKDGDEIRSTLLKVGQIKYYEKYFYTLAEVPTDKLEDTDKYSRLRVAGHGGWSYLTGIIGEDVPPDHSSPAAREV